MQIDPNGTYAVTLNRVVRYGAFTYRPRGEFEMAGTLVQAILDQEGEEAFDHVHGL